MRGMVVRRVLCALVVLACAVLIGFHGGAASYMLFWASWLVPLISWLYRRVIARSLRVTFRVSNHSVLREEHTSGVLTLTNESVFPIPSVHIRLTAGKIRFSDSPEELFCSLRPGEVLRLPFDLVCRHCGAGTVGAERVYVRDIFALAEQSFTAIDHMDVLPRTRHVQDLVVAPVREKEHRSTVRSYFGEGIPDGQLKAYQPGEDVRRIHWKASVLQGKPIMRNLAPEPKNEIVLLPDSRAALPEGRAGWVVEDSVIEGTLVIADYFLRHQIPLAVIPGSRQTVHVSVPAHYLKLYELCSSGYFSGQERPDELLHRDVASRGVRSYIILTWELDESFIRRVSACIDMGAVVSLVYIGDSPEAKTLALAERRMAFFQVTQQSDIFAVLGGTGEKEAGVE